MKIGYKYKIQWAFGTHKTEIAQCKAVIKALGARSLTVINFRDENGKNISNYSNMVGYIKGESEKQTFKAIAEALKKYPAITEIELLRY